MLEFTDFQGKIAEKLPNIDIRFSEPLSAHTSFRIGGPAEVMAFPRNPGELSEILKVSDFLAVKPVILGAGTNVLAPDEGVRGLVICLKDCMSGMELLDSTHIRVGAGITMSRAAVYAAANGLSGMEFAHGIPGTVGGGVYMNAGAYGGEIAQICERVSVMLPDGTLVEKNAAEMGFSYRHSCLEADDGIVVSAVFRLHPDDPDAIRGRMKELITKRSASQPLDLPSAGSAFKRPVGGYAAALIDQSGLKGYRVGNAAISTKHAGFAVNLGGATASDVRMLLQRVSDRVFSDSGIRLEPEIRIW